MNETAGSKERSLTGRRALVTGGASGIGAAIALAMAQAGADVAITQRKRAPGDLGERIAAEGGRFHAATCDLNGLDAAGAEALVEEVSDALGGIDILVNNAGVIRREPAVSHSEEDWREVLSVGLDAPFFLAQAAGRRMAEEGFGRIVNMGSVLSFQGGILVPSYAAAKHAVVGMTRALCNEWAAQGITVNAIAPGYVETEMTSALREDDSRSRDLLARIPAGRWGRPEDIAAVAVFLASDAAGYVNGHALAVDGGWLCR